MQTQKTAVTCPITGAPMRHVFTHRVLGRHDVGYYYSDESGLLRTEKPYWLDEAYQDAISDADTGVASRNVGNSMMLDAVVHGLGLQDGRFLDLAGGYGLLTRLMRDKGYDCYTTDKYCTNLFAKAFEPAAGFQADALFAFEVLEHLEDPLAFLTEAFSAYNCRTIVFSTLTFTGDIPPTEWWYYSFEGGQHIALYQPRTLALLAERLRCNYLMLNAGLHVITDRPVGRFTRFLLTKGTPRRWYGALVRRRRRRRSLTWEDHLQMQERMRARG